MRHYGTRLDIGAQALAEVATQRGQEVWRLREELIRAKDEHKRELRELRAALAVIGTVGCIDGWDVIRRSSVLEIVDDRLRRRGSAT